MPENDDIINDPAGDPPDSEITGPSSEPNQPVFTAGDITVPVVRTGLQAVSGEFIVQGLDAFHLVTLDGTQRAWLVVALTTALAWVQNVLEKWRGRRILGTEV